MEKLMTILVFLGQASVAFAGDERSEKLGQGIGTLLVLIVAPFILYKAYKFGKRFRDGEKK